MNKISILRIKTLIKHSFYYERRSFEAWADTVWWSIVSLFIFGFLAVYFAETSGTAKATTILVGFILWDVVRLGQESIAVMVLREVWNRNLSNLFMTPLSTLEYILAQMIYSVIKTSGVFVLISVLAYYLYDFEILRLGWGIPLYYINLLMFAWAAGIFILGMLFRFGTRLQALAWSLIVIIQPISGVFYPVEILPNWIQPVAYIIPVTYIFEAARETYLTGFIDLKAVAIAFVLNIFCIFGAWIFFHMMFARAKDSGEFARLEG